MKENLFTSKSIRTISGEYVNVFDPDIDSLKIYDIAHALSQQVRFGAHLPMPYTVAQHCISCARIADHKYKFDALMHDCSEAYLLDIPKPIKQELPDYKNIEDKLMNKLSKKFGFNYPLPKQVKDIDMQMLKTEWAELMIMGVSGVSIDVLSMNDSKELFLTMYRNLKPKKEKS